MQSHPLIPNDEQALDQKAFKHKNDFIFFANKKINKLEKYGNRLLEKIYDPVHGQILLKTNGTISRLTTTHLAYNETELCRRQLRTLAVSPETGYAEKERNFIKTLLDLNEIYNKRFMEELNSYRNMLEQKTNPPTSEKDTEHAGLFFTLRNKIMEACTASLISPNQASSFLQHFSESEELLTHLHREKTLGYRLSYGPGYNELKDLLPLPISDFKDQQYLIAAITLRRDIILEQERLETIQKSVAQQLIDEIVALLPEAMQKKTREEHTTKLKEIMALGRLHEITAFIETLKEIKARTDEQFNLLRESAVYYINKLTQVSSETKETQKMQEAALTAKLETKKTQKDLREFIAELRTSSHAAEKIQKLLSLVKSPEEKKTCQQDHDSAFQQAKSSSNEENMKPLEDYFKELDYKIKRAERAQNPVQIHTGTTYSPGLYQPIPTAPKGSINNPNPLPQKPPGFLEKIFKR